MATSKTSVASAGVGSASEGGTFAGTLEASWGVRTECSYVGSQDKIGDPIGDPKNLIYRWYELVLSDQSTNAIQRAIILRHANALISEFRIAKKMQEVQ